MDFTPPRTSWTTSPSSTPSSTPRSSRWRTPTTTSVSSTIAANTPAPIGKRWPAAPRMGGAARKARAPGRQGRPSALRLPKEFGGKGGTNSAMAVIREHLAAKGLGLHNDLQNEHSIVGNYPLHPDIQDVRHQRPAREVWRRTCRRRDPHRRSA